MRAAWQPATSESTAAAKRLPTPSPRDSYHSRASRASSSACFRPKACGVRHRQPSSLRRTSVQGTADAGLRWCSSQRRFSSRRCSSVRSRASCRSASVRLSQSAIAVQPGRWQEASAGPSADSRPWLILACLEARRNCAFSSRVDSATAPDQRSNVDRDKGCRGHLLPRSC